VDDRAVAAGRDRPPCVAIYLLLQKYYVSGFLSGAVK
jgi:ABC-type maltose transport system permease subunit